MDLDFPSATPQLYLRIRSVEGGLLTSGSSKEVEVVGSRSKLQSFLEEIQFRHPVRHWVGSSPIELEACQWDMGVLRDTCKTGALTVEVEPVDDIPVIFSLNHPWALPLEVDQDTPSSICCFKIHDTDLRSTGADEATPFAIRIMAKYGNITMNSSQSVVLKEQEKNLIGIEGYPFDLEQVLDSLVYIPPANMTHFHGFDHLCLFLRRPVWVRPLKAAEATCPRPPAPRICGATPAAGTSTCSPGRRPRRLCRPPWSHSPGR